MGTDLEWDVRKVVGDLQPDYYLEAIIIYTLRLETTFAGVCYDPAPEGG